MAGDKLLFSEIDNTISIINFNGILENSIPTNGEEIHSIKASSIKGIFITQWGMKNFTLDEGENWEPYRLDQSISYMIDEKIVLLETPITSDNSPILRKILYSNDNNVSWTKSSIKLEKGLGFNDIGNLNSDEQLVISGNNIYSIKLN